VTAAQPLHQQPDRITAELIHELARATPRLPSAACRGHTDLFDATVAMAPRGHAALYRARAEALQICATCRALVLCRRWVDTLDPEQRPRGAIAGRVERCTEKRFT